MPSTTLPFFPMASLSLSLPAFSSSRPLARSSNERQALFSRIAPVYDNAIQRGPIRSMVSFAGSRAPLVQTEVEAIKLSILNDLLSLGQHRIWKRMAVSWSGARKGDWVLDLCCGSGDLAFLLSQKVGFEGKELHVHPGCDRLLAIVFSRIKMVTGLDFSREQLLIASARQNSFWKPCYKNIAWIEGDALDLPFPDSYFDAITVGYGLRNLVDKHAAMKEVFRVLKPGSRVSILDFNKSTNSSVVFIQEWMINNVVVPVASNYGLAEEYTYLKSSIDNFLTGKELEKLANEVGFSKARHYEIGGGLMGNLVATR